MDLAGIKETLVSEVGLGAMQADVYLLVTCHGRMTAAKISSRLGVLEGEAGRSAKDLVGLGAFIDMPGGEFEAMHPRFTAVNMYRRSCERRGAKFARNRAVDAIGAALEGAYDDARTK